MKKIERRAVFVGIAMTGLLLLVVVVGLDSGATQIGARDYWTALTGGGGPHSETVLEVRLPRIFAAIAAGAALALAGSLFQSVTRNPLGSPDIIGFNTGAFSGALIAGAVIPATQSVIVGGFQWEIGYYAATVGAIVGGIGTAMVVLALGGVTRDVAGSRLVVVGIATNAMLVSVNTWIILRAELKDAMSSAVWGFGTLNGMTWPQAQLVGLGCAIGVLAIVLVSRKLRLLECNDDVARGLGVDTGRWRVGMVLLGVLLTASVTAVLGPITFVALAAPQIARRLVRGAGVALGSTALVGAIVLATSDVVAQRLPVEMPVGVVTISVGGLYLVWLLLWESRMPQRR